MPQVTLAEFLTAVQAGELVSFPTDTVPALAAQPAVSDRIYRLKQRSHSKPLIMMGATLEDLWTYVAGTEADRHRWAAVARRYWPGALTLVLPASDRLPPAMNPQGTGTLGLRVPDHPLAQYLLERTGPLATTSLNRSGQPPLETMAAIQAEFSTVVTLAEAAIARLYPTLTGQAPPPADRPQGSGLPSTVVAWQPTGWQVLRQGAIAFQP